LLRWVGREGNWLVATAASRSRAGVTYRVRVHLVTRAATCDCPSSQARGYCWHVAAAREGAWRYNDTLEVLRASAPGFPELQTELLAPARLDGVVALAWLAAKRVAAERQTTATAA
jgi:hypothetical protein